MNAKTKITFLGGVGEIGKNMTAIEYGDEIIVIDAGLTFPGEDLPGVDLVVPDFTYLETNKKKVKGIFLTHGHEDHIGAIPFLLKEVNVPVYGSRLTLALVENKVREHKITFKGIAVKPKNVLKLGSFTIEFIKVCHSIAGALALHITTPSGNIIHTGDFKIDFEPVDGVMTDLARFGELGKKGVDLLLCESTNVTRPGHSMSESNVGRELEGLFERFKERRIIVSTFASNVHRLQQVIDLAVKFKRKLVFTGRSMINVSEAAMKVGELRLDKTIVIDVDKIKNFADKELIILSTGSQGEQNSALSRIASGDFKGINVGENDAVIIAASPIPGNEKSVNRIINMLYKLGAEVINDKDEMSEVHASGHACQDELRTIHSLVKPKFFMPVHGEYRHMKRHKELAVSMGMQQRNILIPSLGMQVELTQNSLKQIGQVTAGQLLVDGDGLGDMDSSVIKERKQLAEDGMCIAVLNVEQATGKLSSEPIIITRGVVYQEEAESFTVDIKANILQTLKEQDLKATEASVVKNNIKKSLSNFIYRRTKRRPMILAVIFFD